MHVREHGPELTRTQGFWATHTSLANIAWFGGTAFGHTVPRRGDVAGIGDTLLCGRNIDTLEKLMGGFWSNVAKTTTGAKRSALDQARNAAPSAAASRRVERVGLRQLARRRSVRSVGIRVLRYGYHGHQDRPGSGSGFRYLG